MAACHQGLARLEQFGAPVVEHALDAQPRAGRGGQIEIRAVGETGESPRDEVHHRSHGAPPVQDASQVLVPRTQMPTS